MQISNTDTAAIVVNFVDAGANVDVLVGSTVPLLARRPIANTVALGRIPA
ncbi:hypothetical protein [Xylella fastidiosa]